jgi:hypothetical protein
VETVKSRDLAHTVRLSEKIESGGRLYKRVLAWSGWAGQLLFSNRRHYPDLGLRPSFTVLRDWTYSWIESEIREAGRALGDFYGVDTPDFRA